MISSKSEESDEIIVASQSSDAAMEAFEDEENENDVAENFHCKGVSNFLKDAVCVMQCISI